MWVQIFRILNKNRAVVFTASQPFTSALVMSRVSDFKYSWVWKKTRPTGHVHAKNKPMKKHEDVLVFSEGTTVHKTQSATRMEYYPQGLKRTPEGTVRKRTDKGSDSVMSARPSHRETARDWTGFPDSILEFPNPNTNSLHPTQKPVDLMEYLIRTYTRFGETVLDFTMGSGTTGVAAMNTGRNFIGIERGPEYFEIAEKRIEDAAREAEEWESVL
jgi:site-specific DNA-methyltransferase (adenine-specific)